MTRLGRRVILSPALLALKATEKDMILNHQSRQSPAQAHPPRGRSPAGRRGHRLSHGHPVRHRLRPVPEKNPLKKIYRLKRRNPKKTLQFYLRRSDPHQPVRQSLQLRVQNHAPPAARAVHLHSGRHAPGPQNHAQPPQGSRHPRSEPQRLSGHRPRNSKTPSSTPRPRMRRASL